MNEFTIWGNTVISFQSIWIQLLQFFPIEVFFIFTLMPSHFLLNPFIHGAFRCESKCDSRVSAGVCPHSPNLPFLDSIRWLMMTYVLLHICKHSSVDFHFSQCPCQSIYNKNKETTSQPLPEKYSFSFSHILWENIPKHYGNLFPQNEGIFSQAVGNVFP